VAATIDRRRILTMTAAILLVTLALLALTMFGPGRPLTDVQADMVALDGAVQTGADAMITIHTTVCTQTPPEDAPVMFGPREGFSGRGGSSSPR
jgi:hypothetical protein